MTTSPDLYQLAANTVRFLAADAVQRANSGHPGMPMGMADAAVALWRDFLRHNPANPTFPNRDRFVLSAGHGSMLIYSLLHLAGYDLPMEELKAFRQWGSKTPGHPEYGHTPGVETTTGPLGQGISTAVGMALAERWLAGQFNTDEFSVVDHYTYVICSDGDLQEGISHEACALAGHWGLGKLIALYDDNGISIDGPTSLSFSEDVLARYEAYGWHVKRVDGHDPSAVSAAIKVAQAENERPSIIACKTTIGYGSPNKANTSGIHGSPMGADEIALTKKALGWDSDAHFYVPDTVAAFMDAKSGGAALEAEWDAMFAQYAEAHPKLAARFQAQLAGDLPEDWENALIPFETGKGVATRNASGSVLAQLVPAVPALLGGSADLTGSNKTIVKGTGIVSKPDYQGRYLYYGIREHGMGAIMNGLALHGGIIPYGGTFLVFSDYMRGAIRLSALMGTRVVYVLSHDSIGLGEDGPTHQPIEHHMALRTIPHLWYMRPADANETAEMWKVALARKNGPSAMALTRQNLRTLPADVAKGAAKGGYVVAGSAEDRAILLATGSEVEIAMDARDQLAAEGIPVRVVSMPCWELFDLQSAEYRSSVLPNDIPVRVSMEAGVTLGWQKYVGLRGVALGLDHFGASAPYETLYQEFGLTADAFVEAVKNLLAT